LRFNQKTPLQSEGGALQRRFYCRQDSVSDQGMFFVEPFSKTLEMNAPYSASLNATNIWASIIVLFDQVFSP
jgi:hypothetical protein